jgi:MFS family permease
MFVASAIRKLGVPDLSAPGSASLAVATAIDAMGRGLFVYLYLLYLTNEVGFSLKTAGAVLSVVTALGLAVTPIAGSLVDRVGSRRMLIASQIICAVGYGGLIFVPASVPMLLLVSGLITVGECVFWVGYPSLVANLATGAVREDWYAFMGMARTAGFSAGSLIGSGVMALLSDRGYRVLLGAEVVAFAVAATVIALRVPASAGVRVVALSETGGGGWMDVLRDRVILQLATAHGFAVLCILTIFQALPLFVVEELELPKWLPGLLLFVYTMMLATCQGFGVRLVAGWRRTRIYLLVATLFAAGAVIFGVTEAVPILLAVPLLFVAAIVTGGADVFLNPLNGSVPTTFAPDALRGRYLALFSLIWSIAGVVSPSLVSTLLSVSGYLLWAGLAVAAAICGAVALYAERNIDPEKARTPAREEGNSGELSAVS